MLPEDIHVTHLITNLKNGRTHITVNETSLHIPSSFIQFFFNTFNDVCFKHEVGSFYFMCPFLLLSSARKYKCSYVIFQCYLLSISLLSRPVNSQQNSRIISSVFQNFHIIVSKRLISPPLFQTISLLRGLKFSIHAENCLSFIYNTGNIYRSF